jgi:hypothetical protein
MLRRVTTLLRPVATKRTTKTTSLFSVRSSRAKTASNLTQTRTFLGLFNNNKKIENEEPGQKTAMELISEVPPIEVEGRVAACDGGAYYNVAYHWTRIIIILHTRWWTIGSPARVYQFGSDYSRTSGALRLLWLAIHSKRLLPRLEGQEGRGIDAQD